MSDTETAAADEVVVLEKQIEACEVRLRFLTVSGYDDTRLDGFRSELLARRADAEERLAELRRGRR